MSFSHYSYGSHQRWVPPPTSGQVQYPRARGAGPSSGSGSRPRTSSSPRGSPRGASGVQEVPDMDWDPEPLNQYHSGDLGGPGPPSGPVLQGRGSPHPLGHSCRLQHQLQRRHLRHSYPQPRGSGGPYLSGILSRGMSGYTREISMGSHTVTSRH